MRRLLLVVLIAVLAAGCSDGDADPEPVGGPTSTGGALVDPGAEVPADVQAFVDSIAPPGEVPFRATYAVLAKLGSTESTVEVEGSTVRFGDVVIEGDRCRKAGDPCTAEVELAAIGLVPRFYADAPGRVLLTDARRPTAGRLVTEEREVAGVPLRCAGVDLGGTVANRYCLTPEGVVGFADTPAVRYELTAYATGP